ncbi:MAG: hypothetical protein ABRQ37_19525 [Candidatus Eremiobacterota bacterium]
MNKLELFDKEVKSLAPWLDTERDFVRFKALFSKELYNMTEFSPDTGSLGIMLEGSGEDYISNLITFMTDSGIGKEQIETFKHLNRYFKDSDPVCFKVDFSCNKDLKISFYHRCDVSFEEAEKIMNELKIKRDSIDYLMKIAPFLSKYKTLYIALRYNSSNGHSLVDTAKNKNLSSLHPSPFTLHDVMFKTFFSCLTDDLGEDFYRAIAATVVKLKISHELIDLFAEFRNSLSSEKHILYVSFAFTDRLERFLKFDYDEVPVHYVLDLYKRLNMSSSDINNYEKYLNVDRFSYFGFKCINDKLPSFKTYFTRKYALRDEQKELFTMACDVKNILRI